MNIENKIVGIGIICLVILLSDTLTAEITTFQVDVGGHRIPAMIKVDEQSGIVEAGGYGSGHDRMLSVYLDYNTSTMVFLDKGARICYISEFVPYIVAKIRELANTVKSQKMVPLSQKAYKFVYTDQQPNIKLDQHTLNVCNGYRMRYTEFAGKML